MKQSDFHRELSDYVRSNNLSDANGLLMRELGGILVRSKEDFTILLTQSGISVSEDASETELIDKFVENAGRNKNLLIGAAFLANAYNKSIGFDGAEEISNDGVKTSYLIMSNYFVDYPDTSDAYYNGDGGGLIGDAIGKIGGGAASGGVVGAIAGAVDSGFKFGGKIAEGQQKKKYGVLDSLQKKQEAKSQMLQAAIQKKQEAIKARKEQEKAKQKTMRTLLIVGGAVVGVLAIVGVIYAIKKNRNK